MHFITILLTLILTISPPSFFNCDGDTLTATIRNNLNGDFAITNDLDNIDEGAFVTLNWRDINLMLPRTFNFGEINFTDRKWWWSYKDREIGYHINNPSFKQRLPNGEIVQYQCEANSYQDE